MPRIQGVRQRIHQFHWDSLVRGVGAQPTLTNNVRLFQTVNSSLAWTNMQTAGQLPSDQTAIIFGQRLNLYFRGTNAVSNYKWTSQQLVLNTVIGDKSHLKTLGWMLPAGGGIVGFDPAAATLTNGVGASSATQKLVKPIILPVRQNFAVQCDFYELSTAVSALTQLQVGAVDDEKIIQVVLDTLLTRDVL